MAHLVESDSYIEILMKKALQNENLEFHEQYRLYENGKFDHVKYVADFLVVNGNTRVIIECDGFRYHAGKDKCKKQKERDAWLKSKGYVVLHFSTDDIKKNIDGVINTVKHYLGLPFDKAKVCSPKRRIFKKSEDLSNPFTVFDVALYCYYRQIDTGVCVVYKYKSFRNDKWSEERIKYCTNVPDGMYETVAIYMALLDLKKPVTVNIFYNGYVYHDNFNVSKTLKSKMSKLLNGENITKNHKISTSYVGFYGDWRWNKSQKIKTMRELKSRCLQISKNRELLGNEKHLEFADIKD